MLFATCLVDTVAPELGKATVRVLRKAGCSVGLADKATCCGQPGWNAGFAPDAARVARTTLAALEQAVADGAVVCVPAGSCATMIRVFWPELFELVGDHDARDRALALAPHVKEFSELLAELGAEPAATADANVAYHHSCHMLRELRINEQPLSLLGETVEWDADERCCGFGGLFSVKQPELSVAMADDKLRSLDDAGADVLVGCDASCLMHLEARARRLGMAIEVKHLAEVLQ